MGAKTCPDCGVTKPLSQFRKGGKYTYCRPCDHLRSRSRDPAAYLFGLAKRRARLNGVAFTITRADIQIPAACPVLGIPIKFDPATPRSDQTPTLDRVDPSKGYVPGNVVVVSWRANRLKSDATPDEVAKIAGFVASALSSGAQEHEDEEVV
jgi:hypothetical protein